MAAGRALMVKLSGIALEVSPLLSRRTKLVLDALHALADAGQSTFTQAAVGAYLRGQQTPMSAWEVRGELSILEALGDIQLDAKTALWQFTAASDARQSKTGAASA